MLDSPHVNDNQMRSVRVHSSLFMRGVEAGLTQWGFTHRFHAFGVVVALLNSVEKFAIL